MRIDAVVLDVGGVMLLPDPELMGACLSEAGVAHRPEDLELAHYGGVAAIDATPGPWSAGGAPPGYLEGLAAAAGVAEHEIPAAAAALHPLFRRPATEVWRRPTPWVDAGLRALAGLDLPAAVVSNADGTVEEQLRRHRLAQVGSGPGLAVAAVVDSAVVGCAKPAPEIFDTALQALDVPPERCVYVGDTVTFDVVGARAAGLNPVHLDPVDYCAADDHPHAPDLPSALPGA